MKARITIIQALRSSSMFGALPEFRDLTSWSAWTVWLKALFALPMNDIELAIYRKCTGRSRPPSTEPKESATIVGRRGGKSKMAALVGAFIAAFISFKLYLSTGERPLVLILARDREQAKVVFSYLTGIIRAVPALSAMVTAELAKEHLLQDSRLVE